MDKGLFGDWGSTLGDREYAEAIAGLGVPASRTEGSRVRWAANLLETEGLGKWTAIDSLDPMDASRMWRRHKLNLTVPAQILESPLLANPDGLLNTLARADPRSLIVESGIFEKGAQRSWRWPLRVGVLPGADLSAVANLFATNSAHGLFRVEVLDGSRETCDLLLLPRSSRNSLFGSYDAFENLRARATVVMTDLEYADALGVRARTEADSLRRQYNASAIVGMPIALSGEMVGAVLRELSHNRPLDEAAFDAVRQLSIPSVPCIVGNPAFMDEANLVSAAHRYDRIVEKGIVHRSIGRAMTEPGVLADHFARSNGFDHETGGASRLAEAHTVVEGMVDEARAPRWIHARFVDGATLAAHSGSETAPPGDVPNPPVGPEGALFIVRVSPSLEGPRASVQVPEKELDFSAGAVLLHVMIELQGVSISNLPWTPRTWREIFDPQFIGQLPRGRAVPPGEQEQMAIAQCPIELPEAGDSTLAVFHVVPHENVRTIVGRISLIHRNRVLQTVRVKAQGTALALDSGLAAPADGIAGASLVRENGGDALDLVPDPPIRDRFDDLADARDFDATLLVADDLGIPPHMTMRRGDHIEQLPLSLASLREPIQKIVTGLTVLTRRPSDQDVLPLTAEKVESSVFTLASFGRLLYQALPAWVQSAERIQVVTRGDAYFPAEFIYDGPAPTVEATVCKNATKALLDGKCGDCPHQKSKQHLCPMRFFGLSRVIERHSSPPDATPDLTSKRRPRPSPARAPFGSFTPVLSGASVRAYEFASSADLVNRMKAALGKLDASALEVDNWDQWREAAARGPKLFVALPHSEEMRGVPVLELGNDLITKTEIATGGLLADGEEPRIVMLLGCSIAEPTTAFATYPSEFRTAGADIVVAAISPILGADSVPIASAFADALHEVGLTGRQTLGELLGLVRRRCLAEGHPGVLGVVAYGDADWVFGGS